MDKLSFSNLDISNEAKRAIAELGYEEATAIQTSCIPKILEGKDVIGHSQTGTGKTAAFGIPSLEKIDPQNKKIQLLILCPTRELCLQVSNEMRKFSKYKHGIKTLPIYGGQPIDRQIKALKGVQVIIGTPGRVIDHINRRTIKLNELKMLVLDEADEMLNMGFREDIETILKGVATERQTILFSATMSKEILAITKKYQKNPEVVSVIHQQLTVPKVQQYYCEVSNSRKIDGLCRIIDEANPKLSVVFCNTKRGVDEVANQLQARGYIAEALHGDIKQHIRTRIMNSFKAGRVDILVATDVAARGIDVDDVEIVFNYDIPKDQEYYVHRIGRTGRAGKAGSAYTFVTGRREIHALQSIQKYTNSKIQLKPIPSHEDASVSKVESFINLVEKQLKSPADAKYSAVLDTLMDKDYTSVDIATALIKMQLDLEQKPFKEKPFKEKPRVQNKRNYKKQR